MAAPLTSKARWTQHGAARNRPGHATVSSVSYQQEKIARKHVPHTAECIETARTSSNEGVGAVNKIRDLGRTTASSSSGAHAALLQLNSSVHQETDSGMKPTASSIRMDELSIDPRLRELLNEIETGYSGAQLPRPQDPYPSSLRPGASEESDAEFPPFASSYDKLDMGNNCQSVETIKHRRLRNCTSITILAMAIFSTVFSAIFLVIALARPKYGRMITSQGGLFNPSSAAFITALFAKLIEISFATVFVAFLGQTLARRSFLGNVRGITLGELSMRTWVVQPGTMFTNWESVRYAGITRLGVTTVMAAAFALLYTSASTALVQPQLKFPGWSLQAMQGVVKSMAANYITIEDDCTTPNALLYGPGSASVEHEVCLGLKYGAMAFHDYYMWLQKWNDRVTEGNSSRLLADRPPGHALYTDNTTIVAPWIQMHNVTSWSLGSSSNNWINNVSMAMPHIGVIQAATDPVNRILQPTELDGAAYNIRAAVPSPFVNVLCVTMSNLDLKPFVYELWDDHADFNSSDLEWYTNMTYSNRDVYLNGTRFDKVFGWGPENGFMKVPPVFPKLPAEYNILLNDTVGMPWGRTALYILARGGSTDAYGNQMSTSTTDATNYAMCQIQVGRTLDCSTQYNVTSASASIAAHCEDPNDEMRYILHAGAEDAIAGNDTLNPNWPGLAYTWARSLSYNDGMRTGNSGNARLLTQLILTGANLSVALPSLAEAIAVQAGSTLIDSTLAAPFVGRPWNYTSVTINDELQWFNALVLNMQYASGGREPFQKGFFVVLFGVFLMNVFVMCYIIWHKDWYADFSEPNALFSLAINSPPSERFAGSCGGGPRGAQYAVRWKLHNDNEHYYVKDHDH